MKNPSDLIVFGEDWGRHPSSTAHLMQSLCVNRNIVWVNSIGLRKPRFNVYDLKRLGQKWLSHHQPTPADLVKPEHMTVLSPLVIPWPGSQHIEYLNSLWLRKQIQPVADKVLRQPPILWTSLPSAIAAVGCLGEKAVVYYCGDDFSALAGVDHRAIVEMEYRLATKADLIITVNEELAHRFPPEKTHIIPHGVDVELFTMPKARPVDLPPGPIAGFYGSIAPWFDSQLLLTVAQLLPNWQFVLIGTPQIDINQLKQLPNVHFLGPKPYTQLPAYVQHWQVSLLPFRHTPQIQACNPLKLREYLSVGKPIVTTSFPAVQAYRDYVYIADNAQSFAREILAASMEDHQHQLHRQASVAQQTWQAQAQKVDELLVGLGD